MAITTETAATCPCCRQTDTEMLWPDTFPTASRLRYCRACQAAYTLPELSSDELAGLYRESYYGPGDRRFWPLLERAVQWFRRRRAAQLDALFRSPSPLAGEGGERSEPGEGARRELASSTAGPGPVPQGPREQAGQRRIGSALDIGCGRGWTLHHLHERGWQVLGVELSNQAASHAREVLRLDVETAGFEPQRYGDGQFDLVILWHVLEHLPQPSEVLDQVARVTKPGGLLAIAVPNLASWQAYYACGAWFHLDLPRHRTHYTAAGLERQLAARGFRVVRARHFSAEQNVYGWIQSLLNLAGLEHNLLYDLLRARSARRIERPWQSHGWQSLASLAGLGLLIAPAIALSVVEATFRRGGTVEWFAVRENRPPRSPGATA